MRMVHVVGTYLVAALLLVGCSKRDTGTEASALVGHWESAANPDFDLYFNANGDVWLVTSTDTQRGTYIVRSGNDLTGDEKEAMKKVGVDFAVEMKMEGILGVLIWVKYHHDFETMSGYMMI